MTVTEQRTALLDIIAKQAISVLFQPIASTVERRIVGYEALSRGPSNSPLHSPLTLFAAARHWGMLSELEALCRKQAIKRFVALGLPGRLFLNVSPETLLEHHHTRGMTLKTLEETSLAPERVVIELTEQSPIENFDLLYGALQHYRAMGFSIALDDLGAGYSSLRLWSELQPEFVKVDRHFIDGIHLDPVKREFVGSILNMAKASHAHVIAEGIERPEELGVLEDMGVDWVQGYWLGRPEAAPDVSETNLLLRLSQRDPRADNEPTLHNLRIEIPGVSRSATVASVLARFQQQASLNSLAILDSEERPIGTVHGYQLSQTMLKPFAHELYARKPIEQLMDRDCLVVDIKQSLQRVSRLLTSRARQRIEEDFILVDEGRYIGLGRVIDVLRQITELKVRQARHANPLTLLPGNVPIQECINRILANGQAAHLCYVDLDSFKPFNDLYGYGKGDEILLGLARILRNVCDPRCDFVGHIGGDDFMLVLRSEDWRDRLTLLNSYFEDLCRPIYRPDHIRGGGFQAPDRQGEWRRHDLLSLSVGVVHLTGGPYSFSQPAYLAELASHAKHQAKALRGFSIYEIEVPKELSESTAV